MFINVVVVLQLECILTRQIILYHMKILTINVWRFAFEYLCQYESLI